MDEDLVEAGGAIDITEAFGKTNLDPGETIVYEDPARISLCDEPNLFFTRFMVKAESGSGSDCQDLAVYVCSSDAHDGDYFSN